MTHKDLVQLAYKWVLKNASCGIAFKEFVSSNNSGECPDVIGFGSYEHSVLIEVKVSRSDFIADRKKRFRKEPKLGMGRYRFMCVPKGLITKDELPDNWGLIVVCDKGKARLVYNPYNNKGGNIWKNGFKEYNLKAERGIMYSALRRLQYRGMLEHVHCLNKAEKEGLIIPNYGT